MLESLVVILHLLTSTGLKSSADLREVCGEFNPIFHTLLPSLLSVHCAGSWCCLEHCQHGHNITSQNLLHLESWNTWSSQSLCEREAVVSPGAALRVSCSGKNWHYWNSLMKQHFPWSLQKKLLFCVSHFLRARSYPQKFYLTDIFVEWVQKGLSSNVLLICSCCIIINPGVTRRTHWALHGALNAPNYSLQ